MHSSDQFASTLQRARAARRRLDLEGHADAVQTLEAAIPSLQSPEEREVATWAVTGERLRDIGYQARDPAELRAAAETAGRLPVDLAQERPDIAARLRLSLGQVAAVLREPRWSAEAERHLTAAARNFIDAREPEEAAATLSVLAWSVQLGAGGLQAAFETLTESLSLTSDTSIRSSVLSQRAQVHLWLGRLDEAQADIDAAWPMTSQADDRAVAYVAWVAALIASLRGQRTVVEEWVRRGDTRRGSWADGNVTGLWYDAVMTDALARVGAVDDARSRLRDLQERAHEEPVAACLAQLSFEARWGDRAAAQQAWESIRLDPSVEPWELARLRLLLAHAEAREGDDPGPLAAEAFDLCDGLEDPAVLLTTEPEIAQQLLSAAASGGSRVASRLLRSRDHWRVQVLGGFAVLRPDGTPVELPRRARRLLAYLALADGPVSRAALAEWLWPEEPSLDVLRRRLRQLLHHVRTHADLVTDTEGQLQLSPQVTVDLDRMSDAVQRARTAPDEILRLSAAREALDELGGELLPAEVLDTDWLEPARARLALNVTWVHTLLAEQASGEGQDELALTHAHAAVAADATNETAAALAIDLLARAGQRAQALTLLDRTRAALSELDLSAGPLISAAERRLQGPS